MRLLLDTHIALWAITEDPKLGADARSLIEGAGSIWVSAVAVWEVAIKHSRKPHEMDITSQAAMSGMVAAGYNLLPVTPEHAAAVEGLPWIHADPFDRLIVAQALYEPMKLVTRDRKVAAYSDTFILA